MRNPLMNPRSSRQSVWDFMNDVERAFEEAWAPLTTRPKTEMETLFTPSVEIIESGDHYLVSADLPGVPQDNIKVDFDQGRLTISGERSKEVREDKEHYHRLEKSYGRFERSFQLPTNVDESRIQARFENGVLEVLVPKATSSKAKAISIESGKQGLFSKVLGSSKTGESKGGKH